MKYYFDGLNDIKNISDDKLLSIIIKIQILLQKTLIYLENLAFI